MAQPAQSIIETLEQQRAEVERDTGRSKRLRALQEFQVERLRGTYADLASQVRYRDALEFFVTDLYGPHDRRGRDRDLRKVLNQWARLLPERGLEAVARALELELLTHALDLAMLDILQDAPLNAATYADAYRRVGRYDDRRRQIDLILAAGRDLAALMDIPALGAALRVAGVPARMLGVMDLHRFLERGWQAFKKMGRADELLRIIERRETQIMRRLIESMPDPLRLRA